MENFPFYDGQRIRWSELNEGTIQNAVESAMDLARNRIATIASRDLTQLTFENTIEALENASEELDFVWGITSHLMGVRDSEKLRKTYNQLLPRISGFYNGITLNDDLWIRVETFANRETAKMLSGIRRRLLEETVADFQDGGATLPAEKKAELLALQAALSEKEQKYAENVLDATHSWEKIVDSADELRGLPKNVLEMLAADAKRHGHKNGFRLTLDEPVIVPLMQYAENSDLRREIWETSSELCHGGKYDNATLIRDILDLRRREAQILGQENFADLMMKRRMAKTGSGALDFVGDLYRKIEPFFREEVAKLEQFRADATGGTVDRLEPFELAFWSEKERRAKHDFDAEEARPYFELNAVLEGLFGLISRLYRLRFVRRSTEAKANGISVWHPDVQFFDVFEENGQLLGSFYLDLFPRDDKRAGAWEDTLLPGKRLKNGDYQKPVAVVAANLTPPSTAPSLLNHREVETLFHEFGHLLHALFGAQDYASLNGTSTPLDFVELPSQIMENWTWQRETLRTFARHHETKQPIPDKLLGKMLAARNFHSAIVAMRQLSFAKMDLELHINYNSSDSLENFIDRILQGYRIIFKRRQPSIVHHFNHIFASHGYAAGYYSYKWAEVLEADAFTRFQKEGLENPKTAKQFREKILNCGNEKFVGEMFFDFMGREPSPDALLQREGLVAR